MTHGVGGAGPVAPDPDEALTLRLRDLSLVDLDALTVGAAQPAALVEAYAVDVADALGEARDRISSLRASLGGADPLGVLDATVRQRASDAGVAGADRVRTRLLGQAEAARALARLAELSANLAPRLFEADRRR